MTNPGCVDHLYASQVHCQFVGSTEMGCPLQRAVSLQPDAWCVPTLNIVSEFLTDGMARREKRA